MVSHLYRMEPCGVVRHLIVSSGVDHGYGRADCHGNGYGYGHGLSEDGKLQAAYAKTWRWGRGVQQSLTPLCGKWGLGMVETW